MSGDEESGYDDAVYLGVAAIIGLVLLAFVCWLS